MCSMCNTGFISGIQRFSLGDGGGIRTTVFMQGCNLRCPWCHNPETLDKKGALMLYKNLCVSCGRCKEACLANIMDNCEIYDRSECLLCGKCGDACLSGAIKLSGKHMTVDEVYNIVSQDIDFYAKSNGGVTVSGGEPLLQADFCEDLAKRCFGNNISVIIDTAGDVPFGVFEKIIPFIDYIYFDLKSDIEGYKKVGADGGRIYDNLSRLSAISKVIARIPVIPGFNDDENIMKNIAGFLSENNIREAHFLPFHRLGSGKYNALGLKYAFGDCIPDRNNSVKRYMKIFTDKNIQTLLEE